jgi:glycosyltransferase involved in cell wall biosynthesis
MNTNPSGHSSLITHHSSRIALATTWEDVCGIATYSRSLVAHLEKHAQVEIISLDLEHRTQLDQLAQQMNACDVIHIQHQYPFFGGMALHRNWFRRLLRRLRKPLVVTIHELDMGEGDIWPISWYKPLFNHYLFAAPRISRIIVHTNEHRNAFLSVGMADAGIEPDIVRVIPEGVPPVPEVAISPEEAKSELGLAGKKVVTIFGFVVRRKGYEVALEALCELPDDVVLLIAGGCHPDDRTGFFEELKARSSERVIVTGYLPDDRIPVVMAATDVIAAPFTEMSNSGSIMRSIAYGKPIVASDLPATREINERLPCLVLARAGDPQDLASGIRGLLDDPRNAVEAVQAYAREFTVARAADEILQIYQELTT